MSITNAVPGKKARRDELNAAGRDRLLAPLIEAAALDRQAGFNVRAGFLTVGEKTADVTLGLLAEAVSAEAVLLYQYQRAAGCFRLLAGRPPTAPDTARLDRLVARAAASGRPCRDNRAAEAGPGRIRDMLALPLNVGGTVPALAVLVNKQVTPRSRARTFSRGQVGPATLMALQALVNIQSARLGNAFRNAQLDTIMRLARAIEFRDRETGEHINRITDYATIIACAIGLPDEEIQLLRYAVPLHDIGKIAIPDKILLKPGPLTAAEMAVIRTHPEIGARLLSGSDSVILQAAETIALCHHERFDGRGYPRGLAGKKIPLYGRITTLADVFDAIYSRRCYKKALPFETAVEIIRSEAGRTFDPRLVRLFLENLWQR